MTDDYVPSGGWTDDPVGVDTINRYEWVSIRKGSTRNWGLFSVPAVWGIFGEGAPGADGVRGPALYRIFLASDNDVTILSMHTSTSSTLPIQYRNRANAITVGDNVAGDFVIFYRREHSFAWTWQASEGGKWRYAQPFIAAVSAQFVNITAIYGNISNLNVSGVLSAEHISADVRNVEVLWTGPGRLAATTVETSGLELTVGEDINNFDYLEFSVVLRNEGIAGFVIVDIDRIPSTYGSFGSFSSNSRSISGFSYIGGHLRGAGLILRIRRLSSTRIRIWVENSEFEGYIYKIIGVRETGTN